MASMQPFGVYKELLAPSKVPFFPFRQQTIADFENISKNTCLSSLHNPHLAKPVKLFNTSKDTSLSPRT